MTDQHDLIRRKAVLDEIEPLLTALLDMTVTKSDVSIITASIRALPSVGVTEATDAPSTDDPVATMISDLSHTGELSMLYRMSIADAITELRAENARLRALPSVGVTEPTDAQTASACMSYRHDFGLLDEGSRASTMFIAREWLRAWRKEFDVQPAPDVAQVRAEALREAANICTDRWAAHMEKASRTYEMDYAEAKADSNVLSIAANEASFCGDAILALITTPPAPSPDVALVEALEKLDGDSLDAMMEVIGEGSDFATYNRGKQAMRKWFLSRISARPRPERG